MSQPIPSEDEDEEEVVLVEHKPEGCNSPLTHHGNHQ